MSKLFDFIKAAGAASSTAGAKLSDAVTKAGNAPLSSSNSIGGAIVDVLRGSAQGMSVLLGIFGSSMALSVVAFATLNVIVAYSPMSTDQLAVLSTSLDHLTVWLDACFVALFGTTVFGGIRGLMTVKTGSKVTKTITKKASGRNRNNH